jgi:ATP-dependent Lon protease
MDTLSEKKIKRFPLLPLRGIIVFPYTIIHLDVGRDKSVKALEEAMLNNQTIFLVTQKDAKAEDPKISDVYNIGTIAEVKQLLKLPGGTIRVLVEGMVRAKIEEYIREEPYFEVRVEEVTEEEDRSTETEALMRSLVYQFEQYVKLSKKISPETLGTVVTVEEPGRLADLIASHLVLKIEDKQRVLEALNHRDRLELLCDILSREIEVLELERKINSRVRKQMEKTQKEYYLREQLKAIQKELGEKDERAAEAEELKAKIEKLKLPREVRDKALKEVGRLEKMPPMAAEAVVVRNYVDWLLGLPWNIKTKDRLDIEIAEKILDEDHYGLQKVKERILEFLAVRQLTKKMKGPILCLVGPPGVGKTSLARSIARSMKRNFVRMSLGGVRDEAEIRGHRRTYVGAMPGRIIQSIKQAGSNNPVFLLDEIDKMSMDFRGDPSAALLEVLDPEQNNSFADHYIEVPFDLSNVMFITTANAQHNIPRPLLDRMEVIYISGYTEIEKVKIAEKYLLPKQMKEHGLTEKNISISTNTLYNVIREYTRESGVRNLERNLATICRKVAKEVVKGDKTSVQVTTGNLNKFLGVPIFRYGTVERENEIGVATGLAWTETGGDILPVEVSYSRGKGKLILTGKLGEVMQESAQAGFSYIRSKSQVLGISDDFFENNDVHIHVPEGAIPKDGPSAGITMATAVISAITNRPIRRDIAMTGEITLRGRVLPVGGIKEKVLAAHRGGIEKVILPIDNKKDIYDIPQSVRKKIQFVFVEHMDEVLKHALAGEEK